MMLVGQKIGPFAIDKELGSGTMGTVYRGTYDKTGQRVAIKMMLPGMGTGDRNAERFEREAAMLKQLNHPNVVRLFGIGKFQGTRYYAMEYIEGEGLDKVMSRRGRMSWEEVVTFGQQLCGALQHAHEKGIIHRDIKPSNLMITSDGTLKLTDFGIAKDLDMTGLTATNCTVGTAAYMSPEQCRGERDISHKSDLYSMGVMFYELVTGHKPFTADNAMEMFIQHVQGTFERPSRVVLDLPVWFDTLICQLLEKKPEHRPLDAAKVAEALNTIQEKVEAMLSAGVDAVKSRRVDRHGSQGPIDEADKEAARSIKGTIKGKKRRKKDGTPPTPLLERKWVQAIGLSLLLIAVVGTIIWMLQPKSPERLYADAMKLIDTRDQDKLDEAYEGPVKEYLSRYGGRDTEQTKKLRQWADEYEIAKCGRDVDNILRKKAKGITLEPAHDAERDALRAVQIEATGDLKLAADYWKEAAKKYDAASGYSQWGQFAASRLKQLQDVDRLEGDINQLWVDVPTKGEPKVEGQLMQLAFLAYRFEKVEDTYNAYNKYDELLKRSSEDAAQRIYYLLALKKTRELKDKAKDLDDLVKRQKLVKKKLEEVEMMKPMGMSPAEKVKDEERIREVKRGLWMDIIALYDKMDGFSESVKAAKEKLGLK